MNKRLPEVVRNYSITELEICDFATNIASFVHLLKRVDFYAIVEHLALTQMIKGKTEATTTRIKRLLEVLSPYSFNLYCLRGKDMIHSDFYLDRNMMIVTHMRLYQNALQTRYYDIGEREQGKYLVQTRSQAMSSGTILQEVHGIDKGIDPNISPGKQVIKPIISPEAKGISQVEPRLGQGRAGIKQKKNI